MRLGILFGMAVTMFFLLRPCASADKPGTLASEKLLMIRVAVLEGDPKGSREANTVRCIAEPNMIVSENRAARFHAGGQIDVGEGKLVPTGVTASFQPYSIRDGQIKMHINVSHSAHEFKADGAHFFDTKSIAVFTTVKLGEKQIVGNSNIPKMWVELTVDEIKPK